MNKVIRVSPADKHYFFGFHDLEITNKESNKALALAVNDISHPPVIDQKAIAGYISLEDKKFIAIASTSAWNYPQGARQQWLGNKNLFVFNDKVDNAWGSHIADAENNKIIQTNSFPIHCLNDKNGDAFYFNYARVHRVGGYGYIGVLDNTQNDDIPSNCGIFKVNLYNNSSELLNSIAEIAACGETSIIKTGYPHYITHLYLNPSKTRIAFLHRYRLQDGGETTRLMSVDTNGKNLRFLAKGFLSHFTWLDDTHIFIWGQKSASIANLRESAIYNNKLAAFGIKMAKSAIKKFIHKAYSSFDRKSFLVVTDENDPAIKPIGTNTLLEDGHPMLCPVNSAWIVNDTYPDKTGNRTLMLYNHTKDKRIDLGKFKMIDAKPTINSEEMGKYLDGVDERIKHKFLADLYYFTRSGLHCDLHPRWSKDGKNVYFDSIHEGSRQIYSILVTNLLQ